MKKWLCKVCGYIYEGPEAPAELSLIHIFIDEDENAEHERRKLRAYAGVDILLRPTAEGCAAAR